MLSLATKCGIACAVSALAGIGGYWWYTTVKERFSHAAEGVCVSSSFAPDGNIKYLNRCEERVSVMACESYGLRLSILDGSGMKSCFSKTFSPHEIFYAQVNAGQGEITECKAGFSPTWNGNDYRCY